MHTTETETDEQLVAAARQGERGAFDALANRHFGMVYAMGLARLGKRDLAEDLAQEVFLRAFLLLDQLESRVLFSHWLSRIARNLAIDWQRRGESSTRIAAMVPFDEIPVQICDAKAVDPRTEASRTEQTAVLWEALERLQPDEREVVLLHFMEGISQRDIANRLGVNHTTVSRQIARSLSAMREVMESTMRTMARGLMADPRATARTATLTAAVLALPAATRTALANAAAQGLQSAGAGSQIKSSASCAGICQSLLKSSLPFLKSGGTIMGYGKTGTAVVAALVIGGSGYYFYQEENAAPPKGLGVALTSQEPVLIKLGLTPGERIVLRTETTTKAVTELPKELIAKMQARQGAGAPPFPAQSDILMMEDVALTAREVKPDGSTTVEFETVGMQTKMEMGGQTIVGGAGTLAVDPGEAPPGSQALDMSKSIGRKAVAHLDKTGNIVSMEGYQDAAQSMKSNLPADNLMNSFMKASNTEAEWTRKYQAYFAPGGIWDGPKKPGDSWKTQSIHAGGQPGQATDLICRLIGWRMLNGRRLAEVSVTDEGLADSASAATSLPGVKQHSSSRNGTLLVDPEMGIIAAMDLNSSSDMSMNFPVHGTTAQTMQIRSTSAIKLSMMN